MSITKRHKIFRVSLILIFLLLAAGINSSFTQFLTFDEEKNASAGHDKKAEAKIPLFAGSSIHAEQLNDMRGVIRITWNVNPEYVDDFVTGRSNNIIDSKSKALGAETVHIIQSQPSNEVLDFINSAGSFFYVVLSRSKIKESNVVLIKNQNYTSIPVVVGKDEVYFHVREIEAKSTDSQSVKITWKKIAKGGMIYSAYRSTRRLDKAEKLQTAVKVAGVIDRGECIDAGIEAPGFYYYAVTAHDSSGTERMYPYPDHNYTMMGVKVAGKQIPQGEPYRLMSIEAKSQDKGVILGWTYAGTIGGKYFRIFRSGNLILNPKEIKDAYFFNDVDITQKTYFDKYPPAGDHYYGILPYSYNADIPTLVRGVHITDSPVKVAETRLEIDGKIQGANEEKKKKENLIEKKEPVTSEWDNIDAILYETFFKGKYYMAVKELQNIIPQTDNENEKAKARLFIGRSYIEMKDFKRALNYFILIDVRKHFPKEARFWEEYSVIRIK